MCKHSFALGAFVVFYDARVAGLILWRVVAKSRAEDRGVFFSRCFVDSFSIIRRGFGQF